MATWKKVLVSGSSANLATLQVDNLANGQVVIGGGSSNLTTTAINGTGNILATTGATGVSASGSFSGSFQGSFVGTSSYSTVAGQVQNNLSQGIGITAFTYNGSSAQTVAVSGASSLNTNAITKWTGAAFANSSLTDNGTIISGASSIQLTGANSSITGSFSGTFSGSINATIQNANTASVVVVSHTASGVTYYPTFVTQAGAGQNLFVDTASGAFTFNANTNTLFTTASVALSASVAQTASFVTASNVFGPFGSNSVTSASFAVTSSRALSTISASFATTAISSSYPFAISGSTIYSNTGEKGEFSLNDSFYVGENAGVSASSADRSIFIGNNAGYQADLANDSNFLGNGAGYQAEFASYSNFLGNDAGYAAANAQASNFLGNNAGYQAELAPYSNFLGNGAGYQATNAQSSNFLGNGAGYQATNAQSSNFLGENAGFQAEFAESSNFLGTLAGYQAELAPYSNFLGNGAGYQATNAQSSNFLGNSAGRGAASASYSNLIGFQAGERVFGDGIGFNNTIIGNNVTLENNRRDSINIGGIIFGTGSYSTITGNPFSGSANGRIGINQPLPQFNFDVSGSGRYTNGLVITGSLIAPNITGSLFGTASWAQNAVTASYVLNAVSSSFSTTASFAQQAGQLVNALTPAGGLSGSAVSYNGSVAVSFSVGAGALIQVNDDTVQVATSSLTTNQLPKYSANSLVGSNIVDTGTQVQIGAGASSGVTVAAGGVLVTGNSTFNNNLSVLGDLVVAGTASFQNTQNLLIGDRFLALASGSTSLTDGGIVVVSSTTANGMSGSAFYLESTNTNSFGRFAVAANVNVSASTVTADEYMVSAKINQASNPVDATPPTWGGSTNGTGNMWITNAGDIFIYA